MTDLTDAYGEWRNPVAIEPSPLFRFKEKFPLINTNSLRKQKADIETDDNSTHYYNIEDNKVYSYNYYFREWSESKRDAFNSVLFDNSILVKQNPYANAKFRFEMR